MFNPYVSKSIAIYLVDNNNVNISFLLSSVIYLYLLL